jgi:hypothetical protein
MVVTIQKPNYKLSCKTPYFFLVCGNYHENALCIVVAWMCASLNKCLCKIAKFYCNCIIVVKMCQQNYDVDHKNDYDHLAISLDLVSCINDVISIAWGNEPKFGIKNLTFRIRTKLLTCLAYISPSSAWKEKIWDSIPLELGIWSKVTTKLRFACTHENKKVITCIYKMTSINSCKEKNHKFFIYICNLHM